MSWNGNAHFSGCRVSFYGQDLDQPLDDYKVCIKATIWNVTDSNVKLQYYSGTDEFSNSLSKKYTRFSGDPTIRWCSLQTDDYAGIKLTTSQSTENQGKITLSVTADKIEEQDFNFHWGAWIGGGVGGSIFLVVFLLTITIVIRRRYLARRLTTTRITAIITHSRSHQMQEGIANPGYTTGPEAPPPYHPTNSQYDNNHGPPPQYPGTQGSQQK